MMTITWPDGHADSGFALHLNCSLSHTSALASQLIKAQSNEYKRAAPSREVFTLTFVFCF